MTDREMTELCAAAIGNLGKIYGWDDGVLVTERYAEYGPLYDGKQALELVRKVKLNIEWRDDNWAVWPSACHGALYSCRSFLPDLNFAIVECVAKLQKELR